MSLETTLKNGRNPESPKDNTWQFRVDSIHGNGWCEHGGPPYKGDGFSKSSHQKKVTFMAPALKKNEGFLWISYKALCFFCFFLGLVEENSFIQRFRGSC